MAEDTENVKIGKASRRGFLAGVTGDLVGFLSVGGASCRHLRTPTLLALRATSTASFRTLSKPPRRDAPTRATTKVTLQYCHGWIEVC